MTAFRLVLIIFFFIGWHAGFTQENQSLRELTGSFRFKNEIYTYTCQVSKNGATLKTRKITNNNAPDTSFSQRLLDIDSTLSDQLIKWGAPAGDTLIAQSASIRLEADTLYKKLDLVKDFLDSVNQRLDSLKVKASNDSLKNIITIFQMQVNRARAITDKLSGAQSEAVTVEWGVIGIKGALYQQLRPNDKDLILSDNDLNTLALEIFYKGEAAKDLTNNPPVTANMMLLNDHIPVYIKEVPLKQIITQQQHDQMVAERAATSDSSVWYLLDGKIREFKDLANGQGYVRHFKQDIAIMLPLDKVQVEFDKGTIKNLIASFSCNKISKTPYDIDFRNNMPISVSGKFDNDFLSEHKIFAYDPVFIQNAYDKEIRDTIPKGFLLDMGYQQKQQVYFKLSELLSYSITLENDKEDYSPADMTYVLTPLQPVVTLTKQLRSKVLTVKAFTDFMGVNKEASNGLIQFEANLNVNFLTRRMQRLTFFPSKYTYQGFLTQANIDAMVTKIEENNKFLIIGPQSVDSNALSQGKKAFFVSPIDLFRYKSNAIDLSVNLWKFNLPQVKSNFHVNGRFGVSRSNVSDSLTLSGNTLNKSDVANERMITYTEANISGEYEWTPDSDHGFSVGYGFTWISVMSEDVKKVNSLKGRINTLCFSGFLATGQNSKIFFRWRLNFQAGNSNLNFNQVQLGYLVDIFSAKQ